MSAQAIDVSQSASASAAATAAQPEDAGPLGNQDEFLREAARWLSVKRKLMAGSDAMRVPRKLQRQRQTRLHEFMQRNNIERVLLNDGMYQIARVQKRKRRAMKADERVAFLAGLIGRYDSAQEAAAAVQHALYEDGEVVDTFTFSKTKVGRLVEKQQAASNANSVEELRRQTIAEATQDPTTVVL